MQCNMSQFEEAEMARRARLSPAEMALWDARREAKKAADSAEQSARLANTAADCAAKAIALACKAVEAKAAA